MKKEKTIQEQADESFENFLSYAPDEIKDDEVDALEIATGKEFSGEKTYMILLGTGGPAIRIVGELNECNEPETARYQFQNWFTEWTTANYSENNEVLLEYAGKFCFEGI